MRNEINFTTRSGKKINLSTIYNVLEQSFYYGEFEYPIGTGKVYKGTHEPIISKELFLKARGNLLVAPRTKYGAKEFYFTKFITCGTCGAGITAEEKFKKLSDGDLKRYVYYHCIKKVGVECHELYIREDQLLKQLVDIIDEVEFDSKGAIAKYQQEVDRYKKFSKIISGKMKTAPKGINIKSYAKYVLSEGSRDEKREILGSLKTKLILKDGKIRKK